jgi:hypothetical protein
MNGFGIITTSKVLRLFGKNRLCESGVENYFALSGRVH